MVDTPQEAMDWQAGIDAVAKEGENGQEAGRLRSYLRWRWDMNIWWPRIAKLVPKAARVVEVGTWKGASAKRWIRAGAGRVYCVDPYRAKHDASWEANQDACEQALGQARRTLAKDVRRGRAVFIRKDSTDAAQGWPQESMDLIYIDGDHSHAACLADLEAWWPALKVGGWMVVDDHILGRWWGDDVIRACKDFRHPTSWRRVKRGRWLCIQKRAT